MDSGELAVVRAKVAAQMAQAQGRSGRKARRPVFNEEQAASAGELALQPLAWCLLCAPELPHQQLPLSASLGPDCRVRQCSCCVAVLDLKSFMASCANQPWLCAGAPEEQVFGVIASSVMQSLDGWCWCVPAAAAAYLPSLSAVQNAIHCAGLLAVAGRTQLHHPRSHDMLCRPVRTYAWGVCEAMNPQHSDTAALNALLFGVAPAALKARTEQLYLSLRSRCLQRLARSRTAQVSIPFTEHKCACIQHCSLAKLLTPMAPTHAGCLL